MKSIKRIVLGFLAMIAILPVVTRADDIDLYMVNPAIPDQRPNVLLVLDNTANWNNWFEGEIAALAAVIGGLSAQFNVGLMMFSETGSPNSNVDGAYVRAAIRQMTADSAAATGNKTKYVNLINSLDKLADKGNSAKYGLLMWEVFQYFSGLEPHGGASKAKTDYTGNTFGTAQSQAIYALGNNALNSFNATAYNSPITDNCQKNFVIIISNGPANDNASDRADSSAALSAAGGSTQAIAISPSGQQSNMADEWARFMATHSLSNRPNVVTYTIAVQPGDWPSGQGPDMVALLASMGSAGKGGAFVASNVSELAEKLNEVFSRIHAVNSVFASVTLPVNVNVRGQFLNQIYMGVFRPDKDASPRWPGNLKQYKLQFDSSGNPTMVDRNDNPVFDASSGFVSATAASYWSTATTDSITKLNADGSYQYGAFKFWDSAYYPDAQGSGTPPNGTRDGVADAPDGEMVEKGGAAQRLRGSLAYNSTTNTERISTRRLYTCTGTDCVSGTALSTMPFSSSNPALTASALNIGSTVNISTLARSAGTCTAGACTATATATTDAAHGFSAGTSITVAGAGSSRYNGVFTVQTTPSATSFTYNVPEIPVPTATSVSGISASLPTASAVDVASMSRSTCTGSPCSATVTVNTASAHGYLVGNSVTITNASPAAYNGPVTVTAVPTATSFQYAISQTETPNPTLSNVAGVTITYYNNTATVSSFTSTASKPVSFSRTAGSTLVTVTLPASSKTPNANFNKITISGVASPDQKYNVTTVACATCSKNSTTFTYNLQAADLVTTPAQPSGTGIQVSPSTASVTITSLIRGNSTCSGSPCTSTPTATATATTATAHGFTTGQTVSISGADQSQYNGNFTVTVTATNKFTYTINTSPASPDFGTGRQVSSNTAGVSVNEFINWIRGQNVRNEDNPSLLSSDVRGYLHGDVLHSQPAIINYNRSGVANDIVVFYGANDGILHAVKGGREDSDGVEKWGFIAPEHFGSFQRMFANSPLWSPTAQRNYFFDGPVTTLVKPVDDNGTLRVSGDGAEAYLFAGMRRGGRTYYAFDVTNPDVPKFQWKISGGSGDFSELGYTWSAAQVGKLKLAAGTDAQTGQTVTADTDVVIFGGGYDQSRDASGPTANDALPQGSATMGRAIYVVNARTGALIWMAGVTAETDASHLPVVGMSCSIAADVFPLDSDADGYVDRVYAVDTCGNVWRVNVGDSNKANWAVGKIFSLGTASGNSRKFLFAPSVVLEVNYDVLLIGSGDREHPFDVSTPNRFYALWDDKGKNTLQATATESDLCDFTTLTLDAGGEPTCSACNWPTKRGWKLNFESCPGEKVVGGAVTVSGITIFSTNVPPGSSCLQSTPSNQCSAGLGEARNYAILYDAAYCGRPYRDTNADGSWQASDRYSVNKGGGFMPTGTPVTTCDDQGNCTTAICIGPDCIKGAGLPSTRRHRVYWHMGIDNK